MYIIFFFTKYHSVGVERQGESLGPSIIRKQGWALTHY